MPATALVWNTLIIITLIAVAAYVIVAVQRARRAHRSRSDERAAALLLDLHKASAQPRAAASAPNAAPAPVPATARSAPATRNPAPQPGPLLRRARILTDTQHLLYLVLRAAMPDHTIMANVRIIDLVEDSHAPDALERDPRLRELARERADFIVCNAELVPVAALMIYAAGIALVPDERVKVAALRELGVRFLRFRADSLPRPAEVRALILG